ncbi:MAG TPA: alpha/beta hydrolase [Acidimicrobiales bacterium]|jgi:pimeloyl-ACP methyl ester carboxylesterase|nr:alpha/beta hydrolase [Acidimicrobiales bacterium]
MATFVLVPGAGTGPGYWHLLIDELRARGHDAIAVDLPCDDDSAGLSAYADVAIHATTGRTDLIVVAHSFGGFTGPLVCSRSPVRRLVLLTAMVPSPGETPAEWWGNTGYEEARREQAERLGIDDDVITTFFHDVPPDLAAEAMRDARDQSATPMTESWPLDAWPDVHTTFLLCRDDRFLPAGFMRRVVRERLGITPDEMDAGHHPMLARPKELADRLDAYTRD